MKKTSCIIIAVICIFSFAIFCFAHSGRTDANGGHYDRSTGEYHFHNGNFTNETTENNNGIDWDYYKEKAQKLDEEEYQKIIGENKNYGFATTGNVSEVTDSLKKQEKINSFIYTFRIITWPAVISFLITIVLMFLIYSIYEFINKKYMSDKTFVSTFLVVFILIGLLTYKGLTKNHIIDYYNSFSFASFDISEVLFILLYLVFSFFATGFIMVVLSELTPLFDERKYKSKKFYNVFLTIVFIILFIVCFDITQYYELFT